MDNLKENEWLKGNGQVHSITPLRTPGVLCENTSTVHNQIMDTMDAFKLAIREGFRLQDVAGAQLYQRRRNNKNKEDGRSNSSDSSGSSTGGSQGLKVMHSPPQRKLSNNSNTSHSSAASACSTGFVPKMGSNINLDDSGNFDVFDSSLNIATPTFLASQTNSIRSSSESENADRSRSSRKRSSKLRNKRQHSELIESVESDDESYDENDDDESDIEDMDKCIVISSDEESQEADCGTDGPPLKKARTDPIVILDD